jgi:hypothetical protein
MVAFIDQHRDMYGVESICDTIRPDMRTLTLCSFLIVATVTARCDRPGMVVTVANESARDLVEVGLKFRNKGAESLHALGTIARQQAKTGRIVFDAESNLVLVFRDAHGTPQSEQIPIYLENVHAPITLHVSDDYAVRCAGCP